MTEHIKRLEKNRSYHFKAAARLRTVGGRENCLTMAHCCDDPLAVDGGQFDSHHMLLGVANGVIDLKTGNLLPGLQEYYISKFSEIPFLGISEPANQWENFLKVCLENNIELIEYLQRLFGYGCTGKIHEHIFPVFIGRGRNGKGTIFETIKYILGPLAGTLAPEFLLAQKYGQAASAPDAASMALKGKRSVFLSETDKNKAFSPSKVKMHSGGDKIACRGPFDRDIVEFAPTHKLFFMSNEPPAAPDYDYAFWERVHRIDFNLCFVNREIQADYERPADLELPEKLKAEAPGILAWLVRGCLAWQDRGLDPPPCVLDATKKYRREEDKLADFIDECCVVGPVVEVKAPDIYAAFRDWYEINMDQDKQPSQTAFGKLLIKKFKKDKSRRPYRYVGIDLI